MQLAFNYIFPLQNRLQQLFLLYLRIRSQTKTMFNQIFRNLWNIVGTWWLKICCFAANPLLHVVRCVAPSNLFVRFPFTIPISCTHDTIFFFLDKVGLAHHLIFDGLCWPNPSKYKPCTFDFTDPFNVNAVCNSVWCCFIISISSYTERSSHLNTLIWREKFYQLLSFGRDLYHHFPLLGRDLYH